MPSPTTRAYEEEIRKFDVWIRELKVKYDQFFAGALDREPVELRARVDKLVARFNQDPPSKYALRFHFNTLLSRYNSFSERWGKTLREREEGQQGAKTIGERFGLKQRLITRCRIRDPAAERPEIERLHRRFVEARERHGQRAVPFEKFAQGIAAQSTRLRSEHGCGQIEVRLVEDGDKIQIRARPGR